MRYKARCYCKSILSENVMFGPHVGRHLIFYCNIQRLHYCGRWHCGIYTYLHAYYSALWLVGGGGSLGMNIPNTTVLQKFNYFVRAKEKKYQKKSNIDWAGNGNFIPIWWSKETVIEMKRYITDSYMWWEEKAYGRK